MEITSLIVSREYNDAKTQFQKGSYVSNLNPLYRLDTSMQNALNL